MVFILFLLDRRHDLIGELVDRLFPADETILDHVGDESDKLSAKFHDGPLFQKFTEADFLRGGGGR